MDYTQTNDCVFTPNLPYPPTGSPPYIIQPVANLAVGASCTISVIFTPQRTGARNGVLIIDSDATNVPNARVPLNGNSASTLGAPTITGMSPSTGAVGATVTITGTNFDTTSANNTVMFNGTIAAVMSSTATSITVTVPVGATTGTISVTTTGGTATSSGSFTVTGTTTGGDTQGSCRMSFPDGTNVTCKDYLYGFNISQVSAQCTSSSSSTETWSSGHCSATVSVGGGKCLNVYGVGQSWAMAYEFYVYADPNHYMETICPQSGGTWTNL